MDSIWLLLLLQVILIALNAVFASAEIAVLSINEAKLERMANDGNRRAKKLFRLTSQPARFLATIQVAITLSGFLGSAFAADNFSEPLVDLILRLGVKIPRETLDAVAVVLITLILSYFTLVFGELVPKRLAMKKPEKVAMGISWLVSGVSTVFKPLVTFLSFSTNVILKLFHVNPDEADDQVSEEEIRMMVDAGSEKGTIDLQEKEFIQNVFEFNDITAKEIVIHRTDVDFLSLEDGHETWDDIICKKRHTLYPVYDGSFDNIIGVLNAKDYFSIKDKSYESIMENAIHSAYFVPDSIKADVLFRNMKNAHSSMSIVIDEHGGVLGIVTMQDLIEELVGDLSEDVANSDRSAPYIEKLSDNTWKVHGNITVSKLEEALGIETKSKKYGTFTGMVFGAAGSILADGEHTVSVEIENLIVEIKKIEARQIEDAIIQIKNQGSRA